MAVKSETRKRKSKKGRVWEVTYTLVKDIPEKKREKKTKPAKKARRKSAKRKGNSPARKTNSKKAR